MNLHVVAYPELGLADYERIQAFRRDHHSLFNLIEPHFTLVFSVPDMVLEEFKSEVKKQTKGLAPIRFCLRAALVNKDAFSDHYDAFLVPEEGFAGITKLHDRLYSDNLSPHHRLDVSYIPHLSVANSPNPQHIKKIVARWNEKDFAIKGFISSLDIINYENGVISTLEKIILPAT